jgi:hypothetical protein
LRIERRLEAGWARTCAFSEQDLAHREELEVTVAASPGATHTLVVTAR